ncbi:MAG TPA: hypothetical protein VL547_02535 [Dinghuibacter sp.]|uniref:hypothetical protein n=1 Tax=Dinghuibacter sp. TaxID=2024697 RepID=UPI002B68772F|nr:hypothetical protein [Dinghuibacter sp.]HTJ10870.1 hypothetical protein [Dinghuibacter sp.]
MDKSPDPLAVIRNLVIVVGIYLYFIAWIYVNAYYGHFGIPAADLKLDYASYLVFSFNVVMSPRFLWLVGALLVVVVLLQFGRVRSFLQPRQTLWLIVGMAALFPWLFQVAQRVAWDDYLDERNNRSSLRSVQFVFRKDSEIQVPTTVLDTTTLSGQDLVSDLRLLKQDDLRRLKLLGESDGYFIVLNQPTAAPSLGMPVGFVYFIDKKDVLLSKIILSSAK